MKKINIWFRTFMMWIWLNTMTIKRYKKYMAKEGIDLSKDCYDVDKHECDGRCQGCTACPKIDLEKPTRKHMMVERIVSHETSKIIHQVMKEWQEKINEESQKIIDLLMGNKEDGNGR